MKNVKIYGWDEVEGVISEYHVPYNLILIGLRKDLRTAMLLMNSWTSGGDLGHDHKIEANNNGVVKLSAKFGRNQPYYIYWGVVSEAAALSAAKHDMEGKGRWGEAAENIRSVLDTFSQFVKFSHDV